MSAEARVELNQDQFRYELLVGDQVAGFAQFHDSGNRIVFTHSEIDDAFAGQGLGKVLAGGALDDAVAREKVIVPVCPFIAAYVRKNMDRYAGHLQTPPEGS
ncbi:GNAT family N-acetyltransferase [Actinophytocola xinjiangensis]|jgi:predicted GNAT family acetyltransferase|uniref:GNAT family N-acetyltransferase n=1 Tax=Actinophytocola xinjiangensis TaxID=485602 RepID=A0A7Z1AZ63_9PSEU|nr:GNAT family N-acetyltransferase [Actinophytocola xinjiangensis]OLF11565.1 GNAT family N-acetyltransferase [Actinophytocola xinjiangensis]